MGVCFCVLGEAGLLHTAPPSQAPSLWSPEAHGQFACLAGWSSPILLQPRPTGPLEHPPCRVPGPSDAVTTRYPKSGLSSQGRVGGIFNPFLLRKMSL